MVALKYEYLTNTPLDEAIKIFIDNLKNNGFQYKTEVIPVSEANGRIISRAVYALRCSPHYYASAMDGIALKAEITHSASESTPVTLGKGDFARVDTGDPVPKGCDAVVMIEDVIETVSKSIILQNAAVPWQHIRQIGEDICMGDMIAPSFTKVTPALIGAFIAGGVIEIEVTKKPVVSIIPTGDEIVSAFENLADGDIPEFNSAIFSAMLSDWGADSKVYPIVPDKLDLIKSAISSAADRSDAVIVIAGSSAGRDDFTSTAVKELGELILHGIAIKPGKPAVLGRIESVPIIGVPGYPVSGIIVMEEIVKPLIFEMRRKKPRKPQTFTASSAKKINSSLKYKEFIRTRIGFIDDKAVAVPISSGAGVVTGFAKASGIAEIPQNLEGVESGESLEIKPLKPIDELKNSVLVIGSHDPLIDEIDDILRRSGDYGITSAHVGSMGGITALLRGEAHLGGIHLLNVESGEYNVDYLRKYFPHGGVTLIRGFGRIQGIMTAKGNPMNIKNIGDIAGGRLSYVNRQKGSGTRILLDYLLEKEGIRADEIYGYEREQFTHTGVAATIAKGSADAGLGIYSAAKTYDLDFVPIWNEQYDFAVLTSALEQDNVKAFISALCGGELRKRLSQAGGYTFNNTGEIIEWEK